MTNFPSQMTKIESYELPAGRYFVADPCFPIKSQDQWDSFCSELDNGDNAFCFEGSEVFAVQTGGDGCWSHEGETYSVEAGLLGAIPEELVDPESKNQGVWVDAPDGLEIDVIHDNYGSFRGVRIGEVEVIWYEFDDESIAEFAYENEDYTVITTPELFATLIDYIDNDQEVEAAARAALPQFA